MKGFIKSLNAKTIWKFYGTFCEKPWQETMFWKSLVAPVTGHRYPANSKNNHCDRHQ